MNKGKWAKKIPAIEGWYACRWRDKNKQWRITPARVTIFGSGSSIDQCDRVISVTEGGTLCVHKGISEEKAKKAFGYTEIMFYTIPLEMPTYSVSRNK